MKDGKIRPALFLEEQCPSDDMETHLGKEIWEI